MRDKIFAVCVAFGTAAAMLSGAVQAHHGDAGRYNEDVTTVVGVVAQWRFINPHSVLVLDVEDENGNVTRWLGEIGNPTSLESRLGWDANTFQPGDRIEMTGRALKNGSPQMTLSEGSILVDADTGEELYRGN